MKTWKTYRQLSEVACISVLAAVPCAVVAQEQEEEHHTLDEITVFATPLARTVENLAQPTAVLTGSDLAVRQSASIGETLSQELGMSSTYFGPVSSRPVIRGQYGERVRVLSNGLDSLDVSGLSEDHQVSVDSILADRVEIIRGPATLLYGSGAAGGLVNVVDGRIVERPLDQPFSGAVSANGDSAIGELAAAGKIVAGSDRVAVYADYFYRQTDDVDIPGFAESRALREAEEHEHEDEDHEDEDDHEEEEEARGTLENTDSETHGGAVGLSFTSDRGFLGLTVSTFNSDYGVPGHHHHEEEHDEEHEEEEEHEDEHGEEEELVRIDLEQIRFDLRGEYNFDAFIDKVNFRFAVNDYEHTELEGDEVGTFFDNQGTDARLELHHAPTNGFEGAFGFQYKLNEFDAIGDEAFIPPSDTTRTSVFLYEEYNVNDDFRVQASGRLENQEIDVGIDAPDYDESAYGISLGAVWSMSDNMTFSANLARTERHPTATELYAEGPHVAVERFEIGSVIQGNGILDKEVSTNLDLTLRGQNDRIEWVLTGFINNADDYILLRPTADEEDGFQVYEYDQADVDIWGYEAEARIELFDNPSGHWHTRIFSDFVWAEEASTGAYLPRIPPLRVGAGLHYTRGALSSGLEVVWNDEQDKVAANELPTESFTMLNLDFAYSIGDGDSVVYLRGKNLTDEEARQHASPLKDIAPLPGRSILAGVRYYF